MIEEVVGLLG